MDEDEMVEILEDIARNARNQSARIQAMKMLREIRGGERSPSEGFEGLYEVQNPGRKAKQAA